MDVNWLKEAQHPKGGALALDHHFDCVEDRRRLRCTNKGCRITFLRHQRSPKPCLFAKAKRGTLLHESIY